MIIRFSLLLVVSAFANFFLVSVFEQLTITKLAELTAQLGSMLLLCAFLSLLLTSLWMVFCLLLASVFAYFSAQQRLKRKLLFYINKHEHLRRFFYFKKARLRYLNQQKCKYLLKNWVSYLDEFITE